MKNLILILAIVAGFQALSQNVPPQAINFQGIAINKDGIPVPGMDELGNPIQNSAIRVRFSIISGSSTGSVSYEEEHLTTTDEFGRFNLEIGRGTATNGLFTNINWGGDKHFLQVEVDLSGLGTTYSLASVQEFISVPYALYAKSAGSSPGDGDSDPTNELQDLVLSGNLLSITNGNAVTLPTQTLTLTGTTLTISGGNSVVIPDAQTLNLIGSTLSISNGNSVTLPVSSDNQTLSISGTSLSITNGNSVILPTSLDNDTTNELQDLVLNGNTLGLTKSGVTVNLSNLSSGSSGLSQNSFCLSGGQYYDLSSLFNTYDNVNVEAVLQTKILIGCYAPSTGDARFWLNRLTGALTPFSIPSSIGYTGFSRHSDNLLYLFGSSFLFVYDVNTGIYLDTIAVSIASGHATVDFKTNKLVYSAGPTTYSYNPVTETQISIPTPAGIASRLIFIGADSVYIGASLYSAQNLIPLISNNLPSMTNFVYSYNERTFTYLLSNFIPNQSTTKVLKTCNRLGGNIQDMSDPMVSYSGGGGTVVDLELKSTINGDAIIKWDGGPFVFNNLWLRANTLAWLKMKANGFVEQITPENYPVGGFDFFQFPKNTVVKLLSNKNCVDNQMVPRGIYLFNR